MKAIFTLAFVALLAVVYSEKICEQVDGNSKCSLSCTLQSQFYNGGSCNEEKKCVCKDTRTVRLYGNPKQLGLCAKEKGDTTCKLECLFYDNYKDGVCDAKTNICYCIHKWASTE